jgi:hypothetical protein
MDDPLESASLDSFSRQSFWVSAYEHFVTVAKLPLPAAK